MAKKPQPQRQAPARMAPARRQDEPNSRDDTALILATSTWDSSSKCAEPDTSSGGDSGGDGGGGGGGE